MNASPSFSSPPSAQALSAASASPHPPAWAPAGSPQQVGMSHALLESHFSAEHVNAASFQPMFTNPYSGVFHSNGVMSNPSAPMLVQPGMYAAHDINSFWKPSPSGHMIKMEHGADMFAPQVASDFGCYPGSQAMVASMSLPAFPTHAPEKRFAFSDAESISSVASPSSLSDASGRPGSAKRGAKRKIQGDASLDIGSVVNTPDSDATKAKKANKTPAQRRPPPSASHVTESGKPFPVIDTSAKHSSLFVPPDTSGLTKREARLVKNRAAAFLSRQRKREQFEEMEVKCRGISMLVWRMWETIAGADAGLDRVDSTSLATVLANEEPMARACLEEVITKKGASIAPTADEIEGTPAPEAQAKTSSALPAVAAPPSSQAGAVELERVRSDLSASLQRERELAAQLDALRASLVPSQSSVMANTMPGAGFEGANAGEGDLSSNMGGVTSLAFKGVDGAEVPLFVPESPLSKFTLGGSTNANAMLDASHAGLDLAKTPTLAMFSENALRNRSAQQLVHDKAVNTTMGLGLDYRFPVASAPSSPSTASCSSMESNHSRSGSTASKSSDKKPNALGMCFVIAGMSLMGAGPAATELPNAEAANAALRKDVRAARRTIKSKTNCTAALVGEDDGEPSSHLSDDDLLMEMGLDSAALSEADDDDEVDVKPSVSSLQTAAANAVSCA